MVGKLYERLEALATAGPRHAPADQLLALRKMLEQALRQRQQKRQQPWANLSQALRQVGAERRLPAALRQALHALRLTANRVLHENYAATPADVLVGFEAVAALLGSLSGVHYNGPRPPVPAADEAPADHGTPQPTPWAGPTWYVHTLSVEPATQLLLVEAETPGAGGAPSEAFWLRLPAAFAELLGAAQVLRPALLLHGPHQLLPEPGPADRPVYQPARVVLEPDYLISVTTVAECVDWKRDLPAWAIQKAFQPDQPSRALLFGNLVNQVLDEEISREDFEFADFVSSRLFRTNALSLSALVEVQTTEGLRTLLADLRQHHATLRQTKRAGFVATSHSGYQQQPLRPEDCFLEPSFLSATYGLQGRLDLLHESADGYDLIELKSTRAVPDKLPWANHQAQAQLYRLLLSSTTGEGEPARGRTSILYSAAGSGAAAVKPVLRDEELIDRLLMIRNELVTRELLLAQASGPAQVAELLRPVLQPDVDVLPKFSQDKAREVADAWARADATERAYCLELVRFSARELRLTMLGADARPGDVGGQAGLWRSSDERKIQSFALLDHLELLEDYSETGYLDASGESLGPCLVFRRALDGPPVNFRAGDTLLLYPRRHRQRPERLLGPLECQVAKVTLALDLGADGRVVVGLRATRLGARYLASHSHWALEPDTYDSYRREWAGLSAFLNLPAERRQRLLARTAPRRPLDWPALAAPATAAPEVVRRALAAPDWFVLCGPPGTGKTRSVLRELAIQLCQADKHALLAAYTNRAVDEICEQLVEAGLPFIRVGSRLGTAPAYRRYLLEAMISDCPTRASVKARLAGTPLYVGTVAGLLGKPELFALKQFDLAVVDEASQVLESPMLALLARVPKFILIGDHRQLPAVVAQEPADSAVAPEAAELLRTELGLSNLRNSYFERLFRRAEAHWPHAHGTLANHYRMHADLVALVNDDFYQGQLHCPEPWQHQPLSRPAWPRPEDAFLARVRDERLIFMPTRRQPADRSLKESSQEAELAARAAAFVAQGYGPAFDPEKSLGIIASYRNQAARIRARLAQLADELNLPALTQVSVDTVERYQGSQRDVIVVSFCCHQEHQLETMVSPDETGTVDRKLNVALTRARQQLILLGNEDILRHAPHHAALLRRCGI